MAFIFVVEGRALREEIGSVFSQWRSRQFCSFETTVHLFRVMIRECRTATFRRPGRAPPVTVNSGSTCSTTATSSRLRSVSCRFRVSQVLGGRGRYRPVDER